MEKYEVTSDILEVLLNAETANGSPFTVQSNLTGKDFTFKVKKKEFKDKNYLHIYVEQGYLSFSYLGYYCDGKIKKSGKYVETASADAASWIFRMVEKGTLDKLADVTFYHTGKCVKCGRVLTDAKSIQSGLGPKCRS